MQDELPEGFPANSRPICGFVEADPNNEGQKTRHVVVATESGRTFLLNVDSESPTWIERDNTVLAFSKDSGQQGVGGSAVSVGGNVVVVRDDTYEIAIFDGESLEWRLRHDLDVGRDRRIFVQAVDKLPSFCSAS